MAENENVIGTGAADQIVTGAGNDTIEGHGGDDSVIAGGGDDYVVGGDGQDTLIGDSEDAVQSQSAIEEENPADDGDNGNSEDTNNNVSAGVSGSVSSSTDASDDSESSAYSSSSASSSSSSSGETYTYTSSSGEGESFASAWSSSDDGLTSFSSSSSGGDSGDSDANTEDQSDFGLIDDFFGSDFAGLDGFSSDSFSSSASSSSSSSSSSESWAEGSGETEDEAGSTEGEADASDDAIDQPVESTSTIIEEAGNDRLEGRSGEDVISGMGGNDLLVGGGAGDEWELVDGKWVYHADRVVTNNDPNMVLDGSDDYITGGTGDDVLIGNAGDDTMIAGTGEDRIIGGVGDDVAYGDAGDDVVNLEDGDDYAEGGTGADTVNAGDGNDVVYGDNSNVNLLQTAEGDGAFANLGNGEDWTTPENGAPEMSQTIDTEAGQTYTLSFELAANLAAGSTSGAVEVLWNGEVMETFDASGGVFGQHSVEITGTGEPGVLSFRNIDAEVQESGPVINTDGPIYSYEKAVEIGGEAVDVAAFAPGQAKLYQMISGKLNVFDTEAGEYTEVGGQGFNINAIGFNAEDDLIYGIAKSNGTDALGNPVTTKDLVMVDAEGHAYRVGETPVGDYVGDFDDSGNLWTFQSSINRITKIDVDNLDADGNPVVENFYLPGSFMQGNTYDIAFSAEDQAFYALVPPGQNGGDAMIHKIDIANLDGAGEPTITSLPVTGTLFDGTMHTGMAKGAYGAVFMDGDGNLYAGLNKGDHDLDGSTGSTGGIYKIEYDFDAGQAYAELMSDAQATGSNDGAVDPRAADPFAPVDTTASVVLRLPELTVAEGGNDHLRGGEGDDEMHGNAGDDHLHGGTGQDTLSGDEGDDKVFGGEGDDVASGGLGADHVSGDAGNDSLSGDAGNDYLDGGIGDDTLDGGSGDDRLFSGAGDDVADGGSGADKIFTGDGYDTAYGGADDDTIDLGALNDVGYGGSGNDFIQGKSGHDMIDGGAGNDKLVGGSGADTITGGSGDDHIWGGQWWRDGEGDTFVYNKGGNKDTIHDFEVDKDQIDLSSYGLTFEDLADRIIDRGWATEINLEGIDQSSAGDKIMLKSIKPDELDESNFLM